ncbi:MAG: 50S ribosomal protein L30 [Candidatus Latescibacteria bacterium]|nr:50S ribosomal protein L30 [Candidatus Latescibacterota bacterium]
MSKKLSITQRRSEIGRPMAQRRTLVALGIKNLHQGVVHDDTPQIRGMVQKVLHLVDVREVEE